MTFATVILHNDMVQSRQTPNPDRHLNAMKRIAFLVLLSCLLPVASAPKYTALGASDAVGIGATPNTAGYVYLISDWMKARYTHWSLVNRGVSGYTAPDIVSNTLSPAIADQPQIVTLWVGGNDIVKSGAVLEPTATLAARYRTAFTTILHRLRTETGAFIVTANNPDISRTPVADGYPSFLKTLAKNDTLALNAIIAEVAAAENVPVVDLYSNPESYNPANFSSDGFHPNNAGYALMAQQFEAVIQAQAWRIVSGLGDLNTDGTVSIADAIVAMRFSAGVQAPNDRQWVAGDAWPAGGNGVIDLLDVVAMARRVAGLVPSSEWK